MNSGRILHIYMCGTIGGSFVNGILLQSVHTYYIARGFCGFLIWQVGCFGKDCQYTINHATFDPYVEQCTCIQSIATVIHCQY